MDPGRDLLDEDDPSRWRALEVAIARGERPAGPPPLHLQLASPDLFRLCANGQTLLLARMRRWMRGVDWVRSAGPRSPLAILPPQRSETARELGSSLRAWARLYLAQLRASPASPLHEGDWELQAGVFVDEGPLRWPTLIPGCAATPLRGPLREESGASSGSLAWSSRGSGDLLLLRAPSPPDGARVKSMRKLARERLLPPLLLWFISGLDAFALLDGRDRLEAARLEGLSPQALILSSVKLRTWTRDEEERAAALRGLERQLAQPVAVERLEAVNRRVVSLYKPACSTVSCTRAWPLPGGSAAWLAEARALCGGAAPGELLAPLSGSS